MSATTFTLPNPPVPSSPSEPSLRLSSPHLLIPRHGAAVKAMRSRRLRSMLCVLEPALVPRCAQSRRSAKVVCLSALGEVIGEVNESAAERRKRVEVVAAAAMTVALGTGNRVLYKLALVPLKHYPFFLAQLATFGCIFLLLSLEFQICVLFVCMIIS
ncbi:putative chloroquine-resistance transporter [Dioscorea sansibarensis]